MSVAEQTVVDDREKAAAYGICGAPCRYGGTSAARKFSHSDLGWMWHCNRPMKVAGEKCWQHR